MNSNDKDNQNVFSGEIDPEIADLIGLEEEPGAGAPDFSDLFEAEASESADQEAPDFSKNAFPQITKIEEEPKPFLRDKNFYKIAIAGEGEISKKVHEHFSKFLKAEDPQDRSIYRSRLIPAYWDLAGHIAGKIYSNIPLPKIILLRYGVLSPSIISAEQRDVLSRIIFENATGEPVYYLDEWIKGIALGQIRASATDETTAKKKNNNQILASRLEKAKGQFNTHSGMISGKMAEIEGLEKQLKDQISLISRHSSHPVYSNLKSGYTQEQRNILSSISEIAKKLNVTDREMASFYRNIDKAAAQLEELKEKASQLGESSGVDDEVILKEFNTVRQMVKLTIGRQGNHFPILMKQYFRANIRDIATRENIIREMAVIESIDSGLFCRTFKRQTNRIVPYIILLPSFGDRGVCWEPFERFNRATSRGRIAIPLFPKDLRSAILYALGDLRWQVEKEKAQHYWMEEGLTGKYYQYFTGKKMKGDVKEAFIQDYILWILKESEGTQKLDREARGVFWRNVPFPQHIKDKLKNRGFVYSELYKRDGNISRSDGY